MEWWKLRDDKGVIGKASLETLQGAVKTVIADYQKTHGRNPSMLEWEALLTNALDCLEVGVVTGVTIARAEADPYEDDDQSPSYGGEPGSR